MENFEYFTTFSLETFLIHKIVLVFIIELKAHPHSLISFQVLLESTMSDN